MYLLLALCGMPPVILPCGSFLTRDAAWSLHFELLDLKCCCLQLLLVGLSVRLGTVPPVAVPLNVAVLVQHLHVGLHEAE